MNKPYGTDDALRDMLAVETELHAAFRRQKDDPKLAAHRSPAALVARIEETIDGHLAALRSLLAESGAAESTLKNTLGSILGTAAGLVDRLRPDEPISRMLRDDYAAISIAVICYEMLYTTALARSETAAADLALAHLRDFAPIVMEISDALPFAVIEELGEEAGTPIDRGVARRAIEDTSRIWEEQAAAASAP